ncbi:MMPL family transporter, partial [Salmonella enterica]|uniref:MMPL family transporter n=1 Tax=Salmonella enterica TaxID=28901 RepID=UPI0015C7A893
RAAELVGLAAAALVLFLVFGSLVAMSIPLITAVISVGFGVLVVGILANVLTVATFAPTLSVLLGLGCGVDYALFIVTRYRQGLLEGA